MTANVGAWRGRPVELAARVPRSLVHCRWLGLDVAGWAQEGLVDFLTCGAFFRDDPALPLRSFREDLSTDTLPLYGSMDCILARPGIRNGKERRSHGMFRAAAAHLHSQGADGIYLFNFFFTSSEDQVEGMVGQMAARSLLFELGGADTLHGRNKCCAVPASLDEYGFRYERDLPRRLAPGQEVFLTAVAAEDSSRSRPQRVLLFLRTTGGTGVAVRLNGQDLCAECSLESVREFARDHSLAEGQQVRAWEAPVEALLVGDNRIAVSAGGGEVELLWADLLVLYGAPDQAGWY